MGNTRREVVGDGDLDGGVDIEAYVANSKSNDNGMTKNLAPDIVGSSRRAYGTSRSFDVALGDLDGDGDLDAWASNLDNQPNRVWINQGGDQGGVAGNFADSS